MLIIATSIFTRRVTEQERILMLFLYAKNESADLTPDQIKKLKQIVEREYP